MRNLRFRVILILSAMVWLITVVVPLMALVVILFLLVFGVLDAKDTTGVIQLISMGCMIVTIVGLVVTAYLINKIILKLEYRRPKGYK